MERLKMAEKPVTRPRRASHRSDLRRSKRHGAAMMTALFVMAVTAAVVIGILDTETMHYAQLRNTIEYDRARYLAEAGAAHALTFLERDIAWRDGIGSTEYPVGSGDTYAATVADGPNGTIVITAVGVSGRISRRLELTVKQGG
jgi:hypothetical protein